MAIRRRLQEFVAGLFRPVDGASLSFVRVTFGLVVLWETWRYAANGWIAAYYIRPEVFFTYYGFQWLSPWPGKGMYYHFAAVAVFAAMVASGFLYRLAAPALFICFTYVFLLDQTRYLNHFYVVSLLALLLAATPAHRSFSLDARLGLVRRSEFVPAWSLFLLRAQIAIVYFFAAVAKLDPDWLRGDPMRSWLSERADFPVLGQFFREPWTPLLFSWGGFLFDLAIVPLLAWRRTRSLAFLAGLAFHLMNAELFDIGIFPWMMMAVSTIFFDPGWPRRVFAFIAREPGEAPAPEPVRRWLVALVLAFLAVQVTFPLRHLLYPGPVAWTEEGHRFSWRMKLRDKGGRVEIHVKDTATGNTWLQPQDDLTPKQRDAIATHPDMLLQYAHRLARLYKEDARTVEVYATASVSLNGRAPQLLVDPSVDLAKQPRNLWHAPWIAPFDATSLPQREENAKPEEE